MTTTKPTSLAATKRTSTNGHDPGRPTWEQDSLFAAAPPTEQSDDPPAGEPHRSPPEQPLRPRLVTPEGAARLLGVGRTTVFRLMKEGELTAIHIGRCTRLAEFEIDAYIERRLTKAQGRPDA